MLYVRSLGFTEDPDYAYLRRLFRELYIRCGFENEFIFDWTIQRFNSRINLGVQPALMGTLSSGSDHKKSTFEEEKVSLENRPPQSESDEEAKTGNKNP